MPRRVPGRTKGVEVAADAEGDPARNFEFCSAKKPLTNAAAVDDRVVLMGMLVCERPERVMWGRRRDCHSVLIKKSTNEANRSDGVTQLTHFHSLP